MISLKKWHRIGIILSIVWLVYSIAHSRNEEIKVQESSVSMEIDSCFKKNIDCYESVYKKYPFKPNWEEHFFVAGIQIVLAWIFTFLCIFTYRWIMRGK